MFDLLFTFKLLLSFFVGGAIVSLSTFAGEKFGPKIAGIIIGLPVVSAIGLFFIGFTQSAEIAAASARVMPLTLALGLVFLLVFVYLYNKIGLWKSLGSGTAVFFIANGLAVHFGLKDIFINATVYFAIVALTLVIVRKYPEKRVLFKPAKKQLLTRAAFAGTIIAAAVIAAKLAGPYWGGILAAFPASYFSTLAIATPLHGIDFTRSIIKSIPSATIGTLLYYLVVNQVYPTHGIIVGTLIGYAVALIWVLIWEKMKLFGVFPQKLRQ